MPVPAIRGAAPMNPPVNASQGATRGAPPQPPPDPFWARPGVMSQTGYLQSAGNTGPGGILDYVRDWITGQNGPHGIIGGDNKDATIDSVIQDLQARGIDTSSLHQAMGEGKDISGNYVTNPFDDLVKKYTQIGDDQSAKVKGIYDTLLQQLGQNQQGYQQGAAQQRSGIEGIYNQGAGDIQSATDSMRSKLQQEAQAAGLQQALGGGATQQGEENIARIQAMNSAAKAGSLGNFDTLSSVYNNLLGTRTGIAQNLSASAQAAATEQARSRYGLSDPADLYAELLNNQNNALLTKQQLELQMKQFEAQQLAAQQAGGGGGGGGRSGGGSSSGSVGASGDPTVTAGELATLYDRGPTSRVDPVMPTSLASQVNTNPVTQAAQRRVTRGKLQAV